MERTAFMVDRLEIGIRSKPQANVSSLPAVKFVTERSRKHVQHLERAISILLARLLLCAQLFGISREFLDLLNLSLLFLGRERVTAARQDATNCPLAGFHALFQFIAARFRMLLPIHQPVGICLHGVSFILANLAAHRLSFSVSCVRSA